MMEEIIFPIILDHKLREMPVFVPYSVPCGDTRFDPDVAHERLDADDGDDQGQSESVKLSPKPKS
jgi:hypothetical protein